MLAGVYISFSGLLNLASFGIAIPFGARNGSSSQEKKTITPSRKELHYRNDI